MNINTIISLLSATISIGGIVFLAGKTYGIIKEDKDKLNNHIQEDKEKFECHIKEDKAKYDKLILEVEQLKVIKEILDFVKDFNNKLTKHEEKQDSEMKDINTKISNLNNTVIEIATIIKQDNPLKVSINK